MRVLLVHNPKSGDDDHGREQLVDLLTRRGHAVDYQQAGNQWHTALERRPDLVAAAGGDGTVSEVVRAIMGREVPVAILPLGTANNVAGWLGLGGVPLEELVSQWPRAHLQPFDVGLARGPWGERTFLESVGVGLLTGMISEIDAGESGYVNRLGGRETRIGAALDVLERLLARTATTACTLQLDDRVMSGDYLLVEILNFGAAGPNLRLAGGAQAADGVLDVVLVDTAGKAVLQAHVSSLRAGAADLPRLRVHHARRLAIDCEPCQFHIDDELWPATDTRVSAIVETRPAAVRFLVPRPVF